MLPLLVVVGGLRAAGAAADSCPVGRGVELVAGRAVAARVVPNEGAVSRQHVLGARGQLTAAVRAGTCPVGGVAAYPAAHSAPRGVARLVGAVVAARVAGDVARGRG